MNTFQKYRCWASKLKIIGVRSEERQNPNHHYVSKKYRNTPPICIAIRLQFVLQCFWCPICSEGRKCCQYSSHLYCGTPPICIAIRLPFISQYFLENLGGCGHRDVPIRGRFDSPELNAMLVLECWMQF